MTIKELIKKLQEDYSSYMDEELIVLTTYDEVWVSIHPADSPMAYIIAKLPRK